MGILRADIGIDYERGITMNNRTEKDLWIEMSIRETWTQAHFAELAYRNIDPKAARGTDAVFSSIHSFLSHCAMVSKMLAADDGETPPRSIGDILGVARSSVIHNRRFRNNLEHYDDRLKGWIRQYAAGANVGTYNIGPKGMFQVPNMIYVSHYDPTSNTFTFVNEDFELGVLYEEAQRIKGIAGAWVERMESGRMKAPFGQSRGLD